MIIDILEIDLQSFTDEREIAPADLNQNLALLGGDTFQMRHGAAKLEDASQQFRTHVLNQQYLQFVNLRFNDFKLWKIAVDDPVDDLVQHKIHSTSHQRGMTPDVFLDGINAPGMESVKCNQERFAQEDIQFMSFEFILLRVVANSVNDEE